MTDIRLSPTQFLLAYVAALVVMGIADGLWLGWLAKDLYKREMGALMTDSVRVVPAAMYYLVYPVGIVFLALGQAPSSLAGAALRGAVLGLMAFGTYDMTNLAVIKGFSTSLSLIDLAYGTVVSSLAAGAGWLVAVRGR